MLNEAFIYIFFLRHWELTEPHHQLKLVVFTRSTLAVVELYLWLKTVLWLRTTLVVKKDLWLRTTLVVKGVVEHLTSVC